MMHLFRHTEFLLLHHDCVIVPGLGAFIANNKPARIDHDLNRIIAPSRYVMFNQAVILDDGLLANSYARCLSISFEEARQLITKEVGILLEALRLEKTIKFGRLGSLTLGEENNLIFIPSSMPEEVSLGIGYPTVNFAGKTRASNFASSINHELENDGKDKAYQNRFKKHFFKVAAIIAIILTVGVCAFFLPYDQAPDEHRASVVPVEAIRAAASNKVNTPRSFRSIESSVKNSLITEINDSVTPSHFLIVATFHNKKEAERYKELYSTKEYPLEIVVSRKLTRVSVASSDNKEELFRKLNSREIASRFPNAWVWSDSK